MAGSPGQDSGLKGRGERMVGSPNSRVKRTRSAPSAPHSPLIRHPLGREPGKG
jgi:hypothetical protein